MYRLSQFETAHATIRNFRWDWANYACASCGCVVLTQAISGAGNEVVEMWPTVASVPDSVPERARGYLTQAIASQHAPAGAIMLAASSVDAMLKTKGFREGSLNARIDQAAKEHLITDEMATWAHEIRLDANDQRHADESAQLPCGEDAGRVIEFAQALAEFLFVLPTKVTRGRKGPNNR